MGHPKTWRDGRCPVPNNLTMPELNLGRHRGRPSNMKEIGRKHPVHQPVYEQHNTPIIVYVTVCTKARKPILADDVACTLLLEAWRAAEAWLVGRYVIMPEHVHLFCAPAAYETLPLESWMAFWKSYAARRWPRPSESPVWQRHFWDTQLRRSESYDQKWQYVVENPVRAGLVARSCDWPYQGEMNILQW